MESTKSVAVKIMPYHGATVSNEEQRQQLSGPHHMSITWQVRDISCVPIQTMPNNRDTSSLLEKLIVGETKLYRLQSRQLHQLFSFEEVKRSARFE